MKKVDPDVLPPFRTENYNTLSRMIGPAALVLFGGGVAAVHLPQAWSGCDFKAVISASIGLGATITGLFLAALELNRTQQFGESTQSYIDQLESLARELKGKYDTLSTDNEELKREGIELSQNLTQLGKGFDGQATIIKKLKSKLEKNEEKLSNKAKSAEELEQKLETEITALNQQLEELENDFNRQTITIEKLKGQLKKGIEDLNELAELAEKFKEEHSTSVAENNKLQKQITILNQQLNEVGGTLADALGLGFHKNWLHARKEVLKTEKDFLAKMESLKVMLEEWRDSKSITKNQFTVLCKGLDGVIKNADCFDKIGVTAYCDSAFIKEYYASLTVMVMNLNSVNSQLETMKKSGEFKNGAKKELFDASRLFGAPMQRVGRHRMLLKQLLKKTRSQEEALPRLNKQADRVNASQRCCEKLTEIQDILSAVVRDRNHKKLTNLKKCADSLVGIKAVDPTWIQVYLTGPSKDPKEVFLRLTDELSLAADVIDDKITLQRIKACAVCLNSIIPPEPRTKAGNEANDNNKEPTAIGSLLKLVEDKITRCG